MKALGLVVSVKKIWKPIFLPRDLLMQPTGTVWTTLIEDHPGIIPVKFGQNPLSGFRGDVFKRNCWRTDGRTHGRRTPDIEGSHFVLRWAKNHIHTNLAHLTFQGQDIPCNPRRCWHRSGCHWRCRRTPYTGPDLQLAGLSRASLQTHNITQVIYRLHEMFI